MIWIIITAIAFLAVVLWMLIETRSTLHLLWVIPIVIGLMVSVYNWAFSLFGYPTDLYEDKRPFQMLSYYIPPEEDQIFVWIIYNDEVVPKAIQLPYDPNEQESLEQIRREMEAGKRFQGEFSGEGPMGEGDRKAGEAGENGGGTNKSSGGMINFMELTVKNYLPKKGYLAEEEM